MTEQYEDPADGFFEAPAPAPTDRKEQRPGGSDSEPERIPLAEIKVRVSTDSTCLIARNLKGRIDYAREWS